LEVEKMKYLPDGGQMKAADKYTIDELGVPSLSLMERAARACVEEIKRREAVLSHVCVVCGSGNNGGDGLAIARMFLEEGVRATAVMAGNLSHLTVEAAHQKQLFEEAGGVLDDEFKEDEYSIIVDAVFGVGLSREVSGKYRTLLDKMNQAAGRKMAVDIPSGVSADTGAVMGTAFQADYTVTFQAQKLGLVLYPGKEYAGEVITADIGISEKPFAEDKKTACTPDFSEYKSMLPGRMADSNKGTYGRVLLIAGSKGMSGAAYLNALGAYRIGAGLVRIYTAEENRVILQGQIPEAIITTYDFFDEHELLRLLDWADVVCIGSGIGTSEKSRRILKTTLENVEVPCVIDADGLNLIAEHRRYLQELPHKNVILTPHMKEFSRLTGIEIETIKERRQEVLREFTAKTGFTCILKDARTFILSGDGRVHVNLSGCAAMAKAGAGDVLAGIAAGLLAQGLCVSDAAVLGSYLHGCAGEYAAKEIGSYGVLAREIAGALGKATSSLERYKSRGGTLKNEEVQQGMCGN